MSSELRPPTRPDAAAPADPIGARLDTLADARGRVSISAWLIGERVDTRRIESGVIARAPTTLEAGATGLAVVYRYGAVVVFGLPREAARAFLEQLAPFVHGALPEPSGDTGELRVAAEGEDRVEPDGVVALRQLELARLQIVAEALGRSALLAYYEARLAHSLERVEPLGASLRERGRVKLRSRRLLVELGDVLFTEMRMLGRAEVSEKPELTWDRLDLDRLYVRLAEAYELRDRDHAIGRKLELLTRTAATLLGLLQNRRSLTVEWYIVILIVVEMALAFLR
jgi:uncharacterized Rmd1/YagE family protein